MYFCSFDNFSVDVIPPTMYIFVESTSVMGVMSVELMSVECMYVECMNVEYITSIAAWIKNPFQRTTEHNHSYNYVNFSFFHQNFYFSFKSFFE